MKLLVLVDLGSNDILKRAGQSRVVKNPGEVTSQQESTYSFLMIQQSFRASAHRKRRGEVEMQADIHPVIMREGRATLRVFHEDHCAR